MIHPNPVAALRLRSRSVVATKVRPKGGLQGRSVLLALTLVAVSSCGGAEDTLPSAADPSVSVVMDTSTAGVSSTTTTSTLEESTSSLDLEETASSEVATETVDEPSEAVNSQSSASVRPDVRYVLNKGSFPDVKIATEGDSAVSVLLESCAVAQSKMLDVGIERGLLMSTEFLPISEGGYPSDEATIGLELSQRMDTGSIVPYYSCTVEAQDAADAGGFRVTFTVLREPFATGAAPSWCTPSSDYPDVDGFSWCTANVAGQPMMALSLDGVANATVIAFSGSLSGDSYSIPDMNLILVDVARAWTEDPAFWAAEADGLPTCGDERFGSLQWWGCGG